MFIDNVNVLNADRPSSVWWDRLRQTPDDPGTIAVQMEMRLSYQEYKELLNRDKEARATVQERMNFIQQQEALQREVFELRSELLEVRTVCLLARKCLRDSGALTAGPKEALKILDTILTPSPEKTCSAPTNSD